MAKIFSPVQSHPLRTLEDSLAKTPSQKESAICAQCPPRLVTLCPGSKVTEAACTLPEKCLAGLHIYPPSMPGVIEAI